MGVTGRMNVEVITAFATRSGRPRCCSGKPWKSWERKRSKRLEAEHPERKEKCRERYYRANPKQHHKLSQPRAKASIKILVFTRIVLPARELNYRAVLSHFESSTQLPVFDRERAKPFYYCLTADQY